MAVMIGTAKSLFADPNSPLFCPARSTYRCLHDFLSKINPFLLVAGTAFGTYVSITAIHIYRRSEKPLAARILAQCFCFLRRFPHINRRITTELAKAKQEIEYSVLSMDNVALPYTLELENTPLSDDMLISRMEAYLQIQNTFNISEGRASGAVYTDIDDQTHQFVLSECFKRFAFTNPLHPELFPDIRRMEAEIVKIVANLFHAPPDSGGTVTSGGTESILLACLSARNRAHSLGITDPVLVVPITAHAAFDKAALLLSMRIRHVRTSNDGRVDIQAMRRAICRSTCLLVGSAPNFPYGTFDHIPDIAKLGEKYGIPVHVDACLGGFIIAFADEIDLQIPTFDFQLPGITSISCDTHKYGYAPKGTSVLIYRSKTLLHHQFLCVSEWPGGIYVTPTLSGSRPGLNIALTWTTLLHFGRDEYVRRAREITQKTRLLADAVRKVPGLKLLGIPDVSVVAFGSDQFNIFAVADGLKECGWNLNNLQAPNGIHFCLTYNQVKMDVINSFLSDLCQVCERVSNSSTRGSDSKTAVLYGMAAQIPDKSLVDEMAHLYLDACYATRAD